MQIRIEQANLHQVQLHTRMPFKYGIATMTHMPQVFVRLQVLVNGQLTEGTSSDLLPPKWFTKNPDKPVAEEIEEMQRVIKHALAISRGEQSDSLFHLWQIIYEKQLTWGRSEQLPPLLANFGTSLVERALIEAVCRAAGKPFWQMLRDGGLGLELGDIHAELNGHETSEYLPPKPLPAVIARHTVGLVDPLTDEEIPANETLTDELPQSLTACIRTYGLQHFKIKVNGKIESDVERLHRIAEVLSTEANPQYAFTLDGNEQFKSWAELRAFWEQLVGSPKLKEFLKHLMFVEQPLHRDAALMPELSRELLAWPQHPPFIIDESDATLESLPTALNLGYSGTSHKNCKGIFKGVANRCLLAHLQKQNPNIPLLMSGEDLCNQGPIALLQDLAVMAALGIQSVERNGHHYVAGLTHYSPEIQQKVLAKHGDLYRTSVEGWPTLNLKDGHIQLASINRAPFGIGFRLDLRDFKQVT